MCNVEGALENPFGEYLDPLPPFTITFHIQDLVDIDIDFGTWCSSCQTSVVNLRWDGEVSLIR